MWLFDNLALADQATFDPKPQLKVNAIEILE